MKITYLTPEKENWYLVAWTLSNKCNYRCSYCPSFLNDGSSGWPEWSTVETFIKNFKVPGKEICYRISGGEPTYWKHFLDMAKLAKENGHIFSFLTNGSQTVEYYKTISQYVEGFIISYHPKYANIDHIVEIIESVDCFVGVNIMMVPSEFDSLYEVATRIHNASDKALVWPKLILDKDPGTFTNNVVDYTTEQLKVIKEWKVRPHDDQKLHRGRIAFNDAEITANDLLMKGLNSHKGWKCWGGLDMLSIDLWGDVYRSECKQERLGTLTDFVLPTNTTICNKDKCVCLSDVYMRKELE